MFFHLWQEQARHFYFFISVPNSLDCVTRFLPALLLRPLNVACNTENRKYHMHGKSWCERMEVEREKKFLISKLKSLKLLLSASNESFANWSLLNWSFKRIVFFVGGGVNLIKWVIFIVGSEFCILLIIKKFKNDRWKSHDFLQNVSSFFLYLQ